MSGLQKWAKGKPLGLVMVAQQFAIGAEPCFEFFRLVKAGEQIEGYSNLPNENDQFKAGPNPSRPQRFENDNEVFPPLPETLERCGSKFR